MGNRLFVGNLPSDISEKDVRGFVEGEGRTVQAVKLVKNKDPDRPRFAFVDLADDAEVKAAIAALNGKELGGRALVVNEAEEKPGMGAGGKSGGGGGGFRSTPHGKEDRKGGGFGMRGQTALPRGSQRGGGRGGGRGS
jgi:RNA recognition motif-containing protein